MASGSFTGTTSNDKVEPKITWSGTPNTAGNYSTVKATLTYSRTNTGYTTYGTWSGGLTINGNKVTGSKRIEITYNSNTVAITHTVTVPHNADGSKSITISATGGMPDTSMTSTSISKTVTLDTIPRATTPTVSSSSVNMGSAVTINLPRASSSFTHDLSYSFTGAAFVTIKTGAGTSYSWTTPDLASKIPSATSGTVTIRCITKNGSTTIGTKTVTMTLKVPTSVVPAISAVAVEEATSGLAAQFGAYIKGKSKIKATITAAGAKGSTIKSYSTTFNGKTYTGAAWTSSALTASGSLSLVTTVTDSRGRTAKKTTTITVLDYTKPSINALEVYRVNAEGAADQDGIYIAVRYKYGVTSLNSKNTASLVAQYKQSTATEWSSLLTGSALSADTTALPESPTFSTDYQYDVRLTVTDWFGESDTWTTQLQSGAVILDISADGLGISFGKTCERAGVEIGWTVLPSGGFSVIVLPDGTDLNMVTTPNTYAGRAATAAAYENCPVTSATSFTLEVWPAGEAGQLFQRLTTCTKGTPAVWVRHYYSSAWGDWLQL